MQLLGEIRYFQPLLLLAGVEALMLTGRRAIYAVAVTAVLAAAGPTVM
jgi:hypothetical protein